MSDNVLFPSEMQGKKETKTTDWTIDATYRGVPPYMKLGKLRYNVAEEGLKGHVMPN